MVLKDSRLEIQYKRQYSGTREHGSAGATIFIRAPDALEIPKGFTMQGNLALASCRYSRAPDTPELWLYNL